MEYFLGDALWELFKYFLPLAHEDEKGKTLGFVIVFEEVLAFGPRI
jgi:hypothetical protein